MQRITIGLDIAKSVFQVHGEDASGQVVMQKRLRRSQVLPFFAGLEPALIGIEACGLAHYWARELRALGHEARLIPAAYVKPFVRRNKNDARDAAAVCTAVGRPDMRFVAIKSVESQASRGLERVAGIAAQAAHPADEQRAQPARRIRHHRGARAPRLCRAERAGCGR